ncbi:MAG: ABC transporter permease [Anaerolineales bacterium]|nr:ABC transporter permease [Anaerolineales bacterium]
MTGQTAPPPVATSAWVSQLQREFLRSPIVGPLATLIIVFILLSFVPNFLTLRSVSGIVNAATLTGFIAVGVTLLMIAGEFDLSVGSIMAMGGYVFGFHVVAGGNPWTGLLLALAVTGVMGLINGVLLVRTGIPSFIVTLGTQFMYTGLLWLYSGSQMLQITVDLPEFAILNGRIDWLSEKFSGANFRTASLWLLLLVGVVHLVLVRTRFGNHVFAVGGHKDSAAAQGVPINRVKLICFVLSGMCAGLAGVLLFAQFKTVRIATGAGQELQAIAAAVVGGTLLSGGSGSIIGALIGVLLISTLRTGVVLTNVIDADNFTAIVGVTIIGAAILNNWVRNRT